MSKSVVSIVRYEKPLESVRKAVDLCGGLDHLPSNARVFIKPNVVFWTRKVVFPKWGVITTSRMIEDIVVLLATSNSMHQNDSCLTIIFSKVCWMKQKLRNIMPRWIGAGCLYFIIPNVA